MYNEEVYKNISFYEYDKEERYKEYSAKNPDMDEEEVVWRVNNNLDKEKYKFDVLVSGHDDPYVIVNKYFKLPKDYKPDDLVRVDGCLVCKVAADAYERMRDQAKAEGYTILINSGYRSIADQEYVYNFYSNHPDVKNVDETAARPCYSEHHTGLAIDVEGSIKGGRNISKTPEAAWLRDNCHRFGFILRYLPEIVEITGYASEPWHLRYIGVEESTDMKEKNIKSLEEYKERFLKNRIQR